MKKLDALLRAAEDATPRPWEIIPHVGIGKAPDFAATITSTSHPVGETYRDNDSAYIVEAVNLAVDLALVVQRAHAILNDKDVCAGTDMPGDPCAACELVDEIEARFGEGTVICEGCDGGGLNIHTGQTCPCQGETE